MAMIQRSTKIPHNVRVRSKDAVVPSVKGIRTIIPSTLGIADRARFGKYVKAADSLVQGVSALVNMRNSGDAELEAMSRDPRLVKNIDAAINGLAAGVDSLVREYVATSTDDPEALAAGTNIANNPTEGDPAAVSGQDAGNWQVFDAATILQREAANKRAAELRHASNAVNPARVQLGLADDADLDPIGSMSKLSSK